MIYNKKWNITGNRNVDKLYHLKVESVAQESISIVTGSEIENKVDLLHQRLGHLNKLQLRELANKDLVKGVNIPKSTIISFVRNV